MLFQLQGFNMILNGKWEVFGRKWVWSVWSYSPGIHVEWLRKYN